jgi:hypothetical protein
VREGHDAAWVDRNHQFARELRRPHRNGNGLSLRPRG